MHIIIKILIVVICLNGVLYLIKMNLSYKNDTSSTKQDIINYFKEKKATNINNGIKTRDLPDFIAKSSYRLMMVKDKTLIFKKGRYYLNLENE